MTGNRFSAVAHEQAAEDRQAAYGRQPDPDPNELCDLVLRQLQDGACQVTVGESKFIQNREVVRLCDRDQIAGEMSLRAVSMVVPAARDHRRQLARAIRDGKRFVGDRAADGTPRWRPGKNSGPPLDAGADDLD
jgi:hypothetical protein